MQIRTRPLLNATILGAGILLVYYLASGIFSYFFVGRVLNSPFFDPAFLTGPTPPFDPATDDIFLLMYGMPAQTFFIVSSCMGLLSCLVFLGAGIGAGAYYHIQHHHEEALSDAHVKGGAAAGALSYVVSTLLGSLISLLIVSPLFERMSQIFRTLAASDPSFPGIPSSILLVWGGSFVVGIVCSTLFWGLLGAALGAIGSVIGKGFTRSEAPAAGLV